MAYKKFGPGARDRSEGRECPSDCSGLPIHKRAARLRQGLSNRLLGRAIAERLASYDGDEVERGIIEAMAAVWVMTKEERNG